MDPCKKVMNVEVGTVLERFDKARQPGQVESSLARSLTAWSTRVVFLWGSCRSFLRFNICLLDFITCLVLQEDKSRLTWCLTCRVVYVTRTLLSVLQVHKTLVVQVC